MTIDVICPLYGAEKYIESLNESIKKQEKVNLNQIHYILTKSKDNTETLLKKIRSTIYYN